MVGTSRGNEVTPERYQSHFIGAQRRGAIFVEKLTPGSASSKVLLRILPRRQETLALDEVLGHRSKDARTRSKELFRCAEAKRGTRHNEFPFSQNPPPNPLSFYQETSRDYAALRIWTS